MNARSYSRLAALLFAIIAVLQFTRAVGGWQIVVNGTTSVPVWPSWIACVVAAGLAWIGFRPTRPCVLENSCSIFPACTITHTMTHT